MTAVSHPQAKVPSSRSLRILHFESRETVRQLVLEALNEDSDGADRVIYASDPEEVIALARSGNFDLAIVSSALSDTSLLSLFSRLGECAPGLPIVATTESTDAAACGAWIQSGVQDVLSMSEIVGRSLRKSLGFAKQRQDRWTKVHRRAERLAQAEEHFRWIVNSNADAVIIVDAYGSIRFSNAAAHTLFGRSQFELSSTPFGFPMVSGQTTELDLHRPDGSTCIAEMRVVESRLGDSPAYVASLRDITERKRLEANVLRSQRMDSIGALAGGIAHDLNNVLSPIVMASQMLQPRLQDRESLGLLQTIDQSAHRAVEMVRQILTFARGLDGRRSTIDPKVLVRDLARILNDTLLKSIRLILDVDAQVPVIRADRTQLHQVLLNLCLNSRDAMPNGGLLTLAVKHVQLDGHEAFIHASATPGSYVVITVTDTGCGMTRELQQKIFDPFFTTKPPGKGTGLGLASAQGIVKSHDGFMTVYSEPGRGSVFKVYLPAMWRGTEDTMQPRKPPEMPRGHAETVLVIDDEASIRQMTCYVLDTYGYRTLAAIDGPDALIQFKEHLSEIDLVITDLMMPNMNGRQIIQVLRSMQPGIRIIASSGLDFEGVAADPEDSHGEILCLPKPFSTHALLTTVRLALDRPTLQNEANDNGDHPTFTVPSPHLDTIPAP